MTLLTRASDPAASRRRRIGLDPRQAFGGVIVVVYAVLAACAPQLAAGDPNRIGATTPFGHASGSFWLGGDYLGRDLASRIVSAAQVGVLAAVESVGFALVVGTALGVLAAYAGGLVDAVIQRLADFLFSFPEFLLGIIVVAALGPGLWHAALSIGIVYTPRFIRVARVEAVGVMQSGFVEAARLARRRPVYLIVRHVLPNISAPVVVLTALSLSTAQLTYASLSFLGFGAQPPTPDFGQMLAEASAYMTRDPLLVIAPAVAIALLVLGFNALGEIVRGSLDPRGRRYTKP